MEAKQVKMQKNCKTVYITICIIRIIIFIGLLVLSGMVLWLFFAPSQLTEFTFSGNISISSPYSVFRDSKNLSGNEIELIRLTARQVGILLIPKLLEIGILLGIMFIAGNIFKNIQKSLSPFDLNNCKSIRKISYLMATLTLVPTLLDLILHQLFLKSTGDTYTFSINFVVLVTAFIFYCLSSIFEYGTILQRQSDETL